MNNMNFVWISMLWPFINVALLALIIFGIYKLIKRKSKNYSDTKESLRRIEVDLESINKDKK
jgi:uncharacterized membrane-anchored protein YhcB (DUF1043 family)